MSILCRSIYIASPRTEYIEYILGEPRIELRLGLQKALKSRKKYPEHAKVDGIDLHCWNVASKAFTEKTLLVSTRNGPIVGNNIVTMPSVSRSISKKLNKKVVQCFMSTHKPEHYKKKIALFFLQKRTSLRTMSYISIRWDFVQDNMAYLLDEMSKISLYKWLFSVQMALSFKCSSTFWIDKGRMMLRWLHECFSLVFFAGFFSESAARKSL